MMILLNLSRGAIADAGFTRLRAKRKWVWIALFATSEHGCRLRMATLHHTTSGV